MEKICCNKARTFKEAESFDIKFWKNAGPAAKFIALWKMVEEFYKIKHKHGYKLRLRRSIQNIKHI